jgi:hypothetical protein
MIAIHDEDGQIRPYRFRMKGETDELVTVQIRSITDRKEEKAVGVHYLIYYCLCAINDSLKTCEIRFRKDSCRWYLTGIK